jgi:hypothetical protein
MAPYFSRRLIKVIDGWQAGSVGKRSKALAIRSILFAEPAVDQWCKQCDVACYRRTEIVGPAIKTLFFKLYVEEETSSWTTQPQVAAKFKGGPPEPPEPGAVFKHLPRAGEVVLNLERLYQHDQFWPSVEHWRAKGLNVSSGIRKYANSQREVIMTVDKVLHEEIYAFGSNSAADIKNAVAEGVTFIGSTAFDLVEITRVFSEFGVPTKKMGLWRSGATRLCKLARARTKAVGRQAATRGVNSLHAQ